MILKHLLKLHTSEGSSRMPVCNKQFHQLTETFIITGKQITYLQKQQPSCLSDFLLRVKLCITDISRFLASFYLSYGENWLVKRLTHACNMVSGQTKLKHVKSFEKKEIFNTTIHDKCLVLECLSVKTIFNYKMGKTNLRFWLIDFCLQIRYK